MQAQINVLVRNLGVKGREAREVSARVNRAGVLVRVDLRPYRLTLVRRA